MIDNISYENMLDFSKELSASATVIEELIKEKNFPELEKFVENVKNYSNYLQNTVDINIAADKAIESLIK